MEVPGVEADDVMGTLGVMATKAGFKTVMSTGDKDMAHQPDEGIRNWDLGDEWQKFTGLPFLYAAWLVHENIDKQE